MFLYRGLHAIFIFGRLKSERHGQLLIRRNSWGTSRGKEVSLCLLNYLHPLHCLTFDQRTSSFQGLTCALS